MHDNMILNNVNEPSAIPMNGSQNFFSRPGSQNNIIMQEEYQYIPGMESKVPSRNGSRQGSRLEVARGGNNRGNIFKFIFNKIDIIIKDSAGGVSRIESLLEHIDKEDLDEKGFINKNNLYDMEKMKEEFLKQNDRKPSIILVNNQFVAQENNSSKCFKSFIKK